MEIIRERSLKEFVENYPVTTVIAIIITVIHIFTYIYGNGPTNFETARKFGALLSSNKNMSELPYMLTSIYQHIGGMMHYLFNMSSLLISGPFLERLFGALRFTVLFNVTGIAGSVATLYFTDNVISSGASGALFGLMGVYVALLIQRHHWLDDHLKQRIVPMVIYGLVYTFVVPNISITGHIGGLVAGMILGMIIKPKPFPVMTPFKAMGQFTMITLVMFIALLSPQFTNNTGNFIAAFSEPSFDMFNSEWNFEEPINSDWLLNDGNESLYEDLAFLGQLYNDNALPFYSTLADVYEDTSYINEEQLLQMQEEIQASIAMVETNNMSEETAIPAQNLKDIFSGLLYVNQLLVSNMTSNSRDFDEEIYLQIMQVYAKTEAFSDNMQLLYELSDN